MTTSFLYTQMPNTKGNISKKPPQHDYPKGGTSKLETSKPLPNNQGYKKPFTGK